MRCPALLASVAIACATQLPAQAPLFRPAPGPPVEVGSGFGKVLLADVNRDGHTDLLTRHQQQEHIAIRLGDGTGRYLEAAGSPIAFGYGPGAMALGHVDNDGLLDLVVTHTGRDTVDVLLGDGRGGFRRAPGSPFAPSTAVDKYNKRTLHLADLNGDGNLDIITVNMRGTGFPTLLGDGRGGFRRGPVTSFERGQTWNAVEFGDVDGDGRVDAVIASGQMANAGSSHLVIRRGDGTGAFLEPAAKSAYVPTAKEPRLLTLADLNGDRRLDAVITHTSGVLSFLVNTGDGQFKNAPVSQHHLGTEAFGLVIADVNRDSRPDLVAATVNSVTVLLGSSSGWAPAPGSPYPAGPGAYNVTVGDVNRDGRPDLAASSFEGSRVAVLLGQ